MNSKNWPHAWVMYTVSATSYMYLHEIMSHSSLFYVLCWDSWMSVLAQTMRPLYMADHHSSGTSSHMNLDIQLVNVPEAPKKSNITGHKLLGSYLITKILDISWRKNPVLFKLVLWIHTQCEDCIPLIIVLQLSSINTKLPKGNPVFSITTWTFSSTS